MDITFFILFYCTNCSIVVQCYKMTNIDNLEMEELFVTNKPKAILFMMISVVLFSIMQLFIRLTSPNVSVFQQIFIRNFVSIVFCVYFIHKDHASYFGGKKSQPYLLLRSFGGFMGLLLAFYATRHALLADVAIVTRTGPFFTTIISVLFLKEKLNRMQIPVLFIIFAGGWLAANPTFNSSFLPLGCALLSAIFNGICYPLLRYFHDREHAMTVIMHFSTFCVVASIPFMMIDFHLPQGIDILYLILIALTGAIGQIFLTYAYRLSPASEIAIYDQFTVVFSIILGFLFLNQVPTMRSTLGGLLITGASIMAYLYNNKKAK